MAKRYFFVGKLYYHELKSPHRLTYITTEISIVARSRKLAQVILDNYSIGLAKFERWEKV